MSPLVSVSWLKQHLTKPNLVILDASVSKVLGMTPIEYDEFCCLSNAVFCDLAGNFHLSTSQVSNTMPTSEQFGREASALGIDAQSDIVIYDNQGVYSAPRAWWMFKAMGFNKVRVLDGGLPAWLEQGLETQSEYTKPKATAQFTGQLQEDMVLAANQVLTAINNDNQQIVDARSYSRFCGTAKEPRPGLRSGHIPSSTCLHFATLLTNGKYKTEPELLDIFAQAGLDQNKQLIASCGSGMTACIVLLAAYYLGYRNLSLYDGSWSEWGADANLPAAIIE